MSDDIDKLKDEEQEKLHEELMVDQEERRPSRSSSAWIGGVVLIIVGLYFLLGYLFDFAFVGNWWAAFILIPAVYSLARAYEDYRDNGRLTERGRSSLIGGLMIATVAFIFLFGLNFGNWWPLFLIVIGAGILLRGFVK